MDDMKREAIEQRFNRIVVFFYCLLLIALPISIALFESMTGFAILFFLIKKVLLCRHDIKAGGKPDWRDFLIPGDRTEKNYLNRFIGVFIGSVVVSVIFSQFPMDSLTGFIGKVLEGCFLYVIFVDCVRTRSHLRNILTASVLTLLVLSLDGIFQFIWNFDFLRQLPLQGRRASASLRHANDFGAYLITFIPLVFALVALAAQKGAFLVQEWRKNSSKTDWICKGVLIATLIGAFIALGFTFSRSSWMGLWFSMLILVILFRRYLIFAIVLNIIFLFIFSPLMERFRDVSFTTDNVDFVREYGNIEQTPENLSKLTESGRSRLAQAHQFGGMGRLGFWEEAGGIIKKYPFFGNGLNTYSKVVLRYAHNCYLQMAAEIGIIGLLAFLSMIAALFWQSVRALAKMKDPYLKAVLIGSLSGLAGLLFQSTLDTSLYSVQLGNLLWIFMGMIVAVSRMPRKA